MEGLQNTADEGSGCATSFSGRDSDLLKLSLHCDSSGCVMVHGRVVRLGRC